MLIFVCIFVIQSCDEIALLGTWIVESVQEFWVSLPYEQICIYLSSGNHQFVIPSEFRPTKIINQADKKWKINHMFRNQRKILINVLIDILFQEKKHRNLWGGC